MRKVNLRIAELRKKRGITQQELADVVGGKDVCLYT